MDATGRSLRAQRLHRERRGRQPVEVGRPRPLPS